MKRIIRIVILLLTLTTSMTASAVASDSKKMYSSDYDWSSGMDAIIQVESGGNRNAKSGNSVGAMQITPACVAECNRILKQRNSKKRFKLSDRYSISKSKEMFLLIQSAYNPLNSIEHAIRSWNGGQNYNTKRTQRYYEKVNALLK